jgi:hypothetical protein
MPKEERDEQKERFNILLVDITQKCKHINMSREKKQGPIRKDVIINNLRLKTFINCIIISNKEMGGKLENTFT